MALKALKSNFTGRAAALALSAATVLSPMASTPAYADDASQRAPASYFTGPGESELYSHGQILLRKLLLRAAPTISIISMPKPSGITLTLARIILHCSMLIRWSCSTIRISVHKAADTQPCKTRYWRDRCLMCNGSLAIKKSFWSMLLLKMKLAAMFMVRIIYRPLKPIIA